MQAVAEGLRAVLKSRTRDAHDRVDALLGGLALGSAHQFAAFLRIQYIARVPIEQWLAAQLAPADVPPTQSPLVKADLAAAGHAPPEPTQRFTAPTAGALGAAWVLAGSSMGNKAILAHRRKRSLEGPCAFLSCAQMPAFFTRLVTHMNLAAADADPLPLVSAATAAFARFEDAARQDLAEVAR